MLRHAVRRCFCGSSVFGEQEKPKTISKQQIVIVFIPTASMFGIIILSSTVRVRDTPRLFSHNLRLENNKIQIIDKV
jgi:hypothetical protein